MKALQLTQQFVDQSNSTNSNTDKLAVIERFKSEPEVLKVLQYTYDSLKQYNVTSANCQKRSDLAAPFSVYDDLFTMLDDLAERRITGHSAIEAVNRFVLDNQEYADLIWCIIDRNLKTRSTVSMINAVIPNLIPTFDVALAKAFDEKTQKKVNWKDGWFVSRKLDGVRCICIMKQNGDVKFYSRAGNEFETLGNIAAELGRMPQDLILDGEICMVDENGKEDFQGIIKEIKRKDHTIKRPKFLVFDMLTPEEFFSQTSKRTFGERQTYLKGWFENYSSELMLVEPLEQITCDDKIFADMLAQSKEEGWEGLMLRKNSTYKGKRSDEVLKVKQMFDEEYVVVDLENDTHRVIVDGQEVEELMLKNVIIEHKGNRVQVGSGFSHEQRRHYFQNPDAILGKQITVQYFEETTNQNGTHSLRFPVIKAVYENKRTF
jgi:DNA ligase-1